MTAPDPTPAADADDRESRARRARDSAIGLPVIGIILLLSPFATVFAVEGRVFGVPVIVAYVFGAWLALILAARTVGIAMAEAAPERAPHPVVGRPPPPSTPPSTGA